MEGPATSTTGGSASANSSTMGTTTSTGSVTSSIPSMSSDAIIQVRFVFFCFFGVVDSGWCWNIFSVCCCCCEILLLEPIFGTRI
jgi:hypothetical protein